MGKEPRYVSDRGHAFVIVGRDNCPWCDKVKELLDKVYCTYAYVNLTNHPEERARLVEAGINTVPQVYHHGSRIGGYEQTLRYLTDAGIDV